MSHDSTREEKAFAQPVDVWIAAIAQPLDRIPTSAEREVHHLTFAERDADVRHAAILTIGKEQQISRQ